MQISELIKKRLYSDYHDKRLTQWDLAKKYNITQTQIQKLLSNQRPVSGLTLATVQKMFPRATIDLDGTGDHIHAVANVGSAVASPGAVVTGADASAVIARVLDAVMASDLDDASKVKCYRVISKCSQ